MLNQVQHDGKVFRRKARIGPYISTETEICYHHPMTSDDPGLRVEIRQLRTELKEAELRMLERHGRMVWLWVIAINLASLALTVAFIRALR
jgi:hypothetical protein